MGTNNIAIGTEAHSRNTEGLKISKMKVIDRPKFWQVLRGYGCKVLAVSNVSATGGLGAATMRFLIDIIDG